MMTLAFRLSDRRGLTLIELVLYGTICTGLYLLIGNFINKPMRLTNQLLAETAQLSGTQAMDSIVNDLHQSATLPTTSAPDQFSFTTIQFAMDGTNAPAVPITYAYKPDASLATGTGSLFRTYGTTTTMVLSNIDAPTTNFPLIVEDPSDVWIVTVLYHPIGYACTTGAVPPAYDCVKMIRRVSVKG